MAVAANVPGSILASTCGMKGAQIAALFKKMAPLREG
jgi:hypothetical protein